MTSQTIDRYPQEFSSNKSTRLENDQLLLGQVANIKNAKAVDVLARFARAWLGMYLDVDNSLTPMQRLQVLASETLIDAVLQGFERTLQNKNLPAIPDIADSLIDETPFDIGYIVLAGLDILFTRDPNALSELPDSTLSRAICFHYANKTEIEDGWLEAVFCNRQQLVAETLSPFWSQLIERNSDVLPGLYHVISHRKYDDISRIIILPVIRQWHHYNRATLRDLLHTALRVADKNELLTTCEKVLADFSQADPRRYMTWLTTAFLLAPEKYDMVLTDYAGRSKEKILPLLDFAVMVLLTDHDNRLSLDANALALILRITAPKFTPQLDRYNNLCDNTRKVMYLFYALATCGDPAINDVLRRLGLIRVMKLYDEVLQFIQDMQVNRESETLDFESFVQQLVAQNRIRSRKKWSDRNIRDD